MRRFIVVAQNVSSLPYVAQASSVRCIHKVVKPPEPFSSIKATPCPHETPAPQPLPHCPRAQPPSCLCDHDASACLVSRCSCPLPPWLLSRNTTSFRFIRAPSFPRLNHIMLCGQSTFSSSIRPPTDTRTAVVARAAAYVGVWIPAWGSCFVQPLCEEARRQRDSPVGGAVLEPRGGKP